jgi:peptide/nickel transport system permease protein
MWRYIVRRLLVMPVLLLGVSILVFGMLQLLSPYERAALYVSDIPKQAGSMDALVKKYGLDDPLPLQYWRWLVGQKDPDTGQITGGLLRGDLGFSKTGKQPVTQMIAQHFPATAELALWSVIPMIWIGIQMGVLAAVNQNKWVDQVVRVVSIVGYSIPVFVFGLLVLMIFYAQLDWFPAGRLSDWASQVVMSPAFHQYTGLNTLDGLLNLRFDIFLDALRHIILPAITLAYLNAALILRVARTSMLEVLRQDYVNTARAKGLAERVVINKHAKPNAMIPVATLGGLLLIGFLNGAVITETVFNYRGMGWFFADAALHLDVVAVLGFVLFNAIILVLGNLVVDVMYAWLDPRVRLT